MDIQLPGMDGLTATSVLHRQPSMKDVPIIAVTGHVTLEHQLRAVEVGCADFLGKPVTSEILLATVNRFLTRKTAP
jgi:CheY-like chemotaxis protein